MTSTVTEPGSPSGPIMCRTWKVAAEDFRPRCTNTFYPVGDTEGCPVCVKPKFSDGNCVKVKAPPLIVGNPTQPDLCQQIGGSTQKVCTCQTLYGDYTDTGYTGIWADTYTKIWKLTVTMNPQYQEPPGGCPFAGTYYLYARLEGKCGPYWDSKERAPRYQPVGDTCETSSLYPHWTLDWNGDQWNHGNHFRLFRKTINWSTGQLESEEWDFGYFGSIPTSLRYKVCKGASYFPWRKVISQGGLRYIPRDQFLPYYDMTIEGL